MNLLLSNLVPGLKEQVAPIDLSPTSRQNLRPIYEPFSGAWQRGFAESRHQNPLYYGPLFRCVTLIASDIAKLGVRLTELIDGIWVETTSPSFSPVLRKPNRFQTWVQFIESWVLSKLIHGNAYVLKVRNNRGGPQSGNVIALYVLDPHLVSPMVAPGATVFYSLKPDNLSPVEEAIVVPASEIMHDRINPLFHPLCGVTPVLAAALSGELGSSIQRQAIAFHKNGTRPSGILTSPDEIDPDTARRLKADFEKNYSGDNFYRLAVAGNGLEFKPIMSTSVDAQLVEHLKLSGEMVCQPFGVPLFKVGLGGPLNNNINVQVLNQIYYSDCLHKHIEDMEHVLDDGLGLPANYGIEFLVRNLLRMDGAAQMSFLGTGVERSIMTINDARKELGLLPVEGGDDIWMQQQDFSLRNLARRDRIPPPLPSQIEPTSEDESPEEIADQELGLQDLETAWTSLLQKELPAFDQKAV